MGFAEIIWLDEVGSTNSLLKEWVMAGQVVEGAVLAARSQVAGRGRFERTWVAPAGCNLTFSAYFRTDAGFPALASIPMAAALGIREYLQSRGIEAQCKWPNDLMVGDKKICGILSERFATDGGGDIIILGIGLNVNMRPDDLERIDKPATSMLEQTACGYSLEDELRVLLDYLWRWLERWEAGGFADIRDDFVANCWRMGENVVVGDGDSHMSGILLGFGESGQILLELEGGEVREVWSGDVE